MYLKNDNGTIIYPYSLDQLRVEHRNVSFPKVLSDDVLSEFGIYRVYSVDVADDYTKNYIELTPFLSGGLYYQNWNVVSASIDDINIRIDMKWMEVRDIRNALLLQSDWTQFQDSPVSGSKLTEWQVYRQGLRDITLQGNPFELVWPEKPD